MRLANDSRTGWARRSTRRDLERGEAVARRLESGACASTTRCLNYYVLELPMGGAKASGMGYRHGPGGIRKFTQHQALLLSRYHLRRDVHMYPYRARSSRLLQRGMRLLYRGRA